MRLDHPLWFRFVGFTGSRLVRSLGRSLKYHFRYTDPMVNPEVARRLGQRYVYAFFHEVMLFPSHFWSWPEMQIMISDHRDGELIARIVDKLGFGVIRGSSTRNGARALREMLRRTDRGHLCITPDGPKGPRRTINPGAIYLASRTGLPIVGLGLAFQRPWRANSWDRFAIPRPGSHATCVFLPPMHVPIDANREVLESYRVLLEQQMNQATLEAETWANQFS